MVGIEILDATEVLGAGTVPNIVLENISFKVAEIGKAIAFWKLNSIYSSLRMVFTGRNRERLLFLKGTKPCFNQNSFATSFLVSTLRA